LVIKEKSESLGMDENRESCMKKLKCHNFSIDPFLEKGKRMKKAKPRVGYSEAGYRLGAIFRSAVKEFEEADTAREKIEKEYKRRNQATELIPQFFAAQERRMEAGVVLLMTTAALLEQMIFSYATTYLDSDSYEEHLDKTQILTKWILLPRICENKEISDDNAAINNLRELLKARNAVVHPKRKELGSKKVTSEVARFLSACRKAETTVDALAKILKSPLSEMKKKPITN
jgi:hypothetical protein